MRQGVHYFHAIYYTQPILIYYTTIYKEIIDIINWLINYRELSIIYSLYSTLLSSINNKRKVHVQPGEANG